MENPPGGNHLTEECRMLLEYVRDAVLFIRESDGRILAANRAAEAVYGYTVAELLELRIFDLLDLSGADPAIPMTDASRGGQITDEGVLFETDHKRADGTTFPVENNARVAVVDGERTIIAVIRDITERRRIERTAHETLEEISQIFDTAADGMRIIDRDFNVTRINHTLAELARIDYDAALGSKCYESFAGSLCHTDGCPLLRVLGGEGKFTAELEKTRADGSTLTCLLTAQPFVVDGEVLGVIEDFRDITERKRAEDLAQHLATHDALTGLPNRLLFTDRLEVALAQAQRGDTNPALMFCDVDHFKAINDMLGHVVGDDVLRSVADTLADVVRKGDTVARLGGDEFVVLLPHVRSAEDALVVARKVLDAMGTAKAYGDAELGATLSIGVAVHEPGEDADGLMRRADDAMYRVKEHGGNGLRLAGDASPATE